MDTLESLRRKLDGAEDLKSVVSTMKAMAASNIGQYETALSSLEDYSTTVALGIVAYLRTNRSKSLVQAKNALKQEATSHIAIVFGSDQGLVGQFNDSLAGFVAKTLQDLPGKKSVWAVGERIQLLLSDEGFLPEKLFPVPGSVKYISPLVGELLVKSQEETDYESTTHLHIFHNKPNPEFGYSQVVQQILPLNENWLELFKEKKWPTKNPPQVVGNPMKTLSALIREYLYISLFQACAESLASENASRLIAMQRAEKSIEELLEELGFKFHRLRQSSIDEELFDVVAGFEALKGND
ncbi:F0F1 ATP synthase subunit gamma [Arundinibacter roseus]|uniref:F0F1 ATP synthase subunit gamma n=1 Tax=Arundinibacter roseus TaxID=2070510 RepID=A0A4R4KM07_9BACT|nr:F0F1 ATP synthase subunit gamma [Arundinibacter roseus]TDB68036.1 F0F1 ATP synthase subunit gamma [Arundinibacter roseus]